MGLFSVSPKDTAATNVSPKPPAFLGILLLQGQRRDPLHMPLPPGSPVPGHCLADPVPGSPLVLLLLGSPCHAVALLSVPVPIPALPDLMTGSCCSPGADPLEQPGTAGWGCRAGSPGPQAVPVPRGAAQGPQPPLLCPQASGEETWQGQDKIPQLLGCCHPFEGAAK